MCTEDVRTLLRLLQDGYSKRDLSLLEQTMQLFADSVTPLIVGTNALGPNEGEWCTGRESISDLLAGDWEHWGDVLFDVDGAAITCYGDVAWIATTATVTDTITAEWRYNGYVGYVSDLLQEEETSAETKMLESVRLGVDLLLGMQQGDCFRWPFRFTAVAVREVLGWRFAQMHFSFATTREPDVRLE